MRRVLLVRKWKGSIKSDEKDRETKGRWFSADGKLKHWPRTLSTQLTPSIKQFMPQGFMDNLVKERKDEDDYTKGLGS